MGAGVRREENRLGALRVGRSHTRTVDGHAMRGKREEINPDDGRALATNHGKHAKFGMLVHTEILKRRKFRVDREKIHGEKKTTGRGQRGRKKRNDREPYPPSASTKREFKNR